ncbi:MAG: thioredoxin family protein [Flavobacteriaceae bacterium]|nr:thioredoxin family protein [Flavobacteriaceae bacterium]
MKQFFIMCSLLFFASCATKKKQVLNKQVTINEEVILLGIADRSGLEQEPFASWFASNYDSYSTNKKIIEDLTSAMKPIELKVFMGTWCSDSQYNVPALYKVLDEIGFDENKLELIAVDRNKTTPESYEKDLNILYVPTIILYKNGKEIHRIVEMAMENIETDLLKIASGKSYKHAYED